MAPAPTKILPLATEPFEAKARVPADTVVVPVKGLAAVRVTLLTPACTNAPVPEISPAKDKVEERLKTRVPLLSTFERTEPVLLPVPSCTIPAATLRVPVKVLLPARMSVPLPNLERPPLPEMTLAKVTELVPVSSAALPPVPRVSNL